MSVGDTTGAGDIDTTFYIFDLKIVCLMLYLKKTKELILPRYVFFIKILSVSRA